MGLTYPLDIDAWAAWQKRQNTLRWAGGEARSLIGRLRGGAAEQEAPVGGVLYTRGAVPRVLIVLDSFSPTSRNSPAGAAQVPRERGRGLWVPEDASSTSTASTPPSVTAVMPGPNREVTGDQLRAPARCARGPFPRPLPGTRCGSLRGSLARLALSTGWFSTVCWCLRRRRCRSDAPRWRSAKPTQSSGRRVAAT